MRVITGKARGIHIQTLDGLDVRPTTEMIKEAVFSSIQFDVEGVCFLDLFAGSGQMGIEALSRNADSAVFVDSARSAQDIIRSNLNKTGLAEKSKVVCMLADSFLKSTREIFDIAFLDPPYKQDILPNILPLIAAKMNDNGIIICETDKNEVLPQEFEGFSLAKEQRYGNIKITRYRKKEMN